VSTEPPVVSSPDAPPVTLAFDLGGTKLAAALVAIDRVLERRVLTTRREAGPGGWVETMTDIAGGWRGRFGDVGVAVTGLVMEGRWSALNEATLGIGDGYPLVEALERRTGRRVHALNDAQAAAWGEYRFGAGRGRDFVFLTVSTGVGGGVVLGGELLRGHGGLAGHVGQIPSGEPPAPLEDGVGGRWIGEAASAAGRDVDARAVFAAAADGEAWAERIVSLSATRLARLCETLQAVLDPELVVVGGGVGLAEGYLARAERALAPRSARLRPTLVRAALGTNGGLLGIADLVRRRRHDNSDTEASAGRVR